MLVAVVAESDLSVRAAQLLTQVFDAHGADWELLSAAGVAAERESLNDFDRVLALGTIPLGAVAGLEKPPTIARIRGRGFVAEDRYAVVTWELGRVFAEAELFRDVALDIEKLVTRDSPYPAPDEIEGLELHVAWTEEELEAELTDLSSASALAFDLEVGRTVLCMSLAAAFEDSEAAYCTAIPEHLMQHELVGSFLRDYEGTLVAHNVKYDVQHLWQLHGADLPFMGRAQDTMLMSYALDERPVGSQRARGPHGLEELARIYLDAPNYKMNLDKWFAEYYSEGTPHDRRAELIDLLHEYCNLDTFYTVRLYHRFCDEFAREREDIGVDLWKVQNHVLMPATFALAKAESFGIKIDRPYLEGVLETLEIELVKELAVIRECVQQLVDEGRTEIDAQEFNPNSTKQLGRLLYDDLKFPLPFDPKRKQRRPSTNKDALKALVKLTADQPHLRRMILSVQEMRNKQKAVRTYVTSLLKRADENDRVHASFMIPGTATGRLSSQRPSLQNIPQVSGGNALVRDGFIPEDGFLFVEADGSQLELRIAALLSGDENLIGAFQRGEDIHASVGKTLWGIDELTYEQRMLAKVTVFGTLYGRSTESIVDGPEMAMLEEMTGSRWSAEEVHEFHAAFKKRYSQLFSWTEKQRQLVQRQGFVVSQTGRVRRWPFIPTNKHRNHAQRQAINTPIQTFASDITLLTAVRLTERWDEEEARPLVLVHDSILCEVREELVEGCIEDIRYEFETPEVQATEFPGLPWNVVPLKLSVKVGPRWGSMTEDYAKMV